MKITDSVTVTAGQIRKALQLICTQRTCKWDRCPIEMECCEHLDVFSPMEEDYCSPDKAVELFNTVTREDGKDD